MPAIVPTSMQGKGVRTLTETTLTASDTFTYQTGDVLILRNPTAGALTITLDGDGGTIWPVDGVLDVNVAPGLTLAAIPAAPSAPRVIPLDTIRGHLQGLTTVTGGTGAIAAILRNP